MRQGRPDEALALADAIVAADGAPPAERLDAELIAAEALLLDGRTGEAAARIAAVEGRIDPRDHARAPGASSCGCAASSTPARARPNEAYHDIAQSASVFDLVGERYQAAVSQFALGRLAQDAGARSIAERHLTDAARRLSSARLGRATSTRASGPWPSRSASAAASTSDRPPTPTTRWSSGW